MATGAGARIVHGCGFDSVPSDLGVLLLDHAARADDAGDLQDTTLVVTALKGGLSGGTLASMLAQQDEVRSSAERRRVVADPDGLSPDSTAEPDRGTSVTCTGSLRQRSADVGGAVRHGRDQHPRGAPQQRPAGLGLRTPVRYREVTGFGAGLAAPMLGAAVSAGVKAAEAGLTFGPSRALLGRLPPAPGQGPSEKTRRTGLFRIQIHASTSGGTQYLARIEAQGDPGYAATSVMLSESALCLAQDQDRLPDRAGAPTLAMATGGVLATGSGPRATPWSLSRSLRNRCGHKGQRRGGGGGGKKKKKKKKRRGLQVQVSSMVFFSRSRCFPEPRAPAAERYVTI